MGIGARGNPVFTGRKKAVSTQTDGRICLGEGASIKQ